MEDDYDKEVIGKNADASKEDIEKVVQLLRQQRNSANLYNSVVLFLI